MKGVDEVAFPESFGEHVDEIRGAPKLLLFVRRYRVAFADAARVAPAHG